MSNEAGNSPEPPPIGGVIPHSRLTDWAARFSFCRWQHQTFMAYDIPSLSEADKGRDWVMILSPNDQFEAGIVSDRLRLAGIQVRFDDEVMGGWIGKMRMRVIQVRTEDYEKARELLNAA